MATNQTTIFNDFLDPKTDNLSAEFSSGIGFYLIAPAAAVEYQIEIFLQVQLAPNVVRQVRLEPSNISTTERITLLPSQITDLGLPMRLAIVPSQGFLLEVILLSTSSNNDLLLRLLFEALNIPFPVNAVAASDQSINQLRILGIF